MIPRRRANSNQARVLLAVLGGHRLTGDISAVAGLSRTSTWLALEGLRRRGLVDWEPDRLGTIRPTCEVVAIAAGEIEEEVGKG